MINCHLKNSKDPLSFRIHDADSDSVAASFKSSNVWYKFKTTGLRNEGSNIDKNLQSHLQNYKLLNANLEPDLSLR